MAKDSPAEKAGLRIHDVVVAFDQQDVYSTEQLVKLIRDTKPGQEISLTLVRDGQQQEAKLKLGEMAAPAGRHTTFRIPFGDRFGDRFPKPELFSRDLFLDNMGDVKNWSLFESLSISKDKDGKYEAKITFKDDEKTLERTFVGTREEIVKAIEEDNELPETARDHLLRGLDMKVHIREFFNPNDFFRQRDFAKELFDWPNLDF